MAANSPNRLLDLLKTGEDSDVTFIVGKQKEEIGGHKMILKAYCGSFKAMFKEQPKLDRVEILDVDPTYFKKFLEIVYNSGSEPASLAAEDVIPLLDLAKRFDAQNVTKLCSKELETVLKESSALKIFQQAIQYKDKELEEAATKLICKEASKLIDSPEFLKLPAEHICKLLSLDELCAQSELQILESCIRWAKQECRRQGTIAKPKYMRSVLEKVIPLIRFSQMNASDFAVAALKHRILTTEEIQEIHLYFHVLQDRWQEIPPGLFNTKSRKYCKQHVSRIIKRLDTKVHPTCPQNSKPQAYSGIQSLHPTLHNPQPLYGGLPKPHPIILAQQPSHRNPRFVILGPRNTHRDSLGEMLLDDCDYPLAHIPGDPNRWHRISFRCDTAVKLVSIGINEECPYSATDSICQATIRVEKESISDLRFLKSLNRDSGHAKTERINKNTAEPIQLKFDEPVKLEANTWYTLSAMVHEPYLGVIYTSSTNGGAVVTQDSEGNSVKFEFKNAVSAGAAQTNVSGGQMAELGFLLD